MAGAMCFADPVKAHTLKGGLNDALLRGIPLYLWACAVACPVRWAFRVTRKDAAFATLKYILAGACAAWPVPGQCRFYWRISSMLAFSLGQAADVQKSKTHYLKITLALLHIGCMQKGWQVVRELVCFGQSFNSFSLLVAGGFVARWK